MSKLLFGNIKGPKGDTGDVTPEAIAARDAAVAAAAAADADATAAADSVATLMAQKGFPNGLAELDSSGAVPDAQLPERLSATALETAIAPPIVLPEPVLALPSASTLAESAFRTLAKARADVLNGTRISEHGFQPVSDGGYGAVWTRDMAMAIYHQPNILSSEWRRAFVVNRLATRSTTASPDPDGGTLPADFVADRITTSGNVIYKNAGASKLPFTDGIAFVVLVAYADWRETQDSSFFLSVKAEIDACLAVLPRDPGGSGLVWSDPGAPSVDFGFTDTVKKTGNVAYGSALLARAYRQCAEMSGENGSGPYTTAFKAVVAGLGTLRRESGWYAGSSGNNTDRDDVWATALIVAEGMCRTRDEQVGSARTLLAAYAAGEITYAGGVRHLPDGQFWAGTVTAPGIYQNGAYWYTPVRECLRVAAWIDPDIARSWATEVLGSWKRDIDETTTATAPYEWFTPGTARGYAGEIEAAAYLARLAQSTAAPTLLLPRTPTASDDLTADTSGNYTLQTWVYDSAADALVCDSATDGQLAIWGTFAAAADVAVYAELSESNNNVFTGVVVRYVDANNYIFVALGGGGHNRFSVYEKVAGTITLLADTTINPPPHDVPVVFWVQAIGNWIVAHAFGATLAVSTSLLTAGVVGARHGAIGSGVTRLHELRAWELTAALPSAITLWDDGGFAGPGDKYGLVVGQGRALDAVGARVARSATAVVTAWQ